MITTKLTELIERDWAEIADQVADAVRRAPDLESLSQQSDHELREWCRDILEHLGNLIAAGNSRVVQHELKMLKRLNGSVQLPLHEAVRLLQILKREIVSFIQYRWLPMTAMQLYTAEEVGEELDRFFEECVYRLVCKYEDAVAA
jgi:hypothetical protein